MSQPRPTAKQFVQSVVGVFESYLKDDISEEKLLESFNQLMTRSGPDDISDELLELLDDIDMDLNSIEEREEELEMRERVEVALSRLKEAETEV